MCRSPCPRSVTYSADPKESWSAIMIEHLTLQFRLRFRSGSAALAEQKARVTAAGRQADTGTRLRKRGRRGERETREPCRFARCGTGITNWPRLILPVHCQRCIIAGKLPNEPHLHLKGAPITPTAFYFIGIVRVAAPRSNYPRRHPCRVAPLFSPDRARSLRFYRLSPPSLTLTLTCSECRARHPRHDLCMHFFAFDQAIVSNRPNSPFSIIKACSTFLRQCTKFILSYRILVLVAYWAPVGIAS